MVRGLGLRHDVVGLDVKASPFASAQGSITDRNVVKGAMAGVHAVIHSATLHKPHVATHARQDFVDVNVTGTLNLLEEAVAAKVGAFIFISTTSIYSRAAARLAGEPATRIDETVAPAPKNIKGSPKWRPKGCASCFITNFSCRVLC